MIGTNRKFSFDLLLRKTALGSGTLALAVAAIPALHSYYVGENDPMTSAVNQALERSEAQTQAAKEQTAKEQAQIAATRAQFVLQKIPQDPTAMGGVPSFDRLDILADPERRISEEFLIPPGLQHRVGFWFDIYTRYDSNKRVIHHALYPWVIFKVVDVEPIVNASYPRFRWMRNEVANELVKKETAKIRKALDSISKKRPTDLANDSKLKPEEIAVRDALLSLGGDARRSAKRARGEVRVQTGQRDFMAEGIQTFPRYMPTMEAVFKSRKLPVELTRLPLVESSFNKHAQSKVGAMGVWQFMESSGKKQKLIVNNVIDERKSVFKSTHAAANQLKENHLILHRSWALAVTAWNHGPGGVRKAYRAAGTKDLSRIIELYHSKSFSFASENFFAEFLAALYTERYSDRVFPGLPKHAPLDLQELRLTRAMKLTEILRVAEMTTEEFLGINPEFAKHIKMNRTMQKGFRIHIPADAVPAVETLMTGRSREKRLIGAN